MVERSRVTLRTHEKYPVAACWDTYKEGDKVVWAGPVVIFGDREAIQTVTVLGVCLNSTGKMGFSSEPRYVHGLETTLVMPGAICRRLEDGNFETPEQAMARTVRDELGRECLSIERLGSPQAVHQSVNDAAQTFVVRVGPPRFQHSEEVIWLDGEDVRECVRRGQIVDSQSLGALTLFAAIGDGEGAEGVTRLEAETGVKPEELPAMEGWDLSGGIQGSV